HGIERWKDDCGCKFNPNTSQKWRKNLRLVIDTIRNTFEQVYVDNLSLLDTIDVRKEYINYLLKRDNEINELQDLKDFICYFSENNSLKDCQKAEKLITLLEIYKNIMFAYTSCGWFFDDISGLEATTNLKFLYYAVKKLKELCKIALEPVIKTILKDTPSNYYPDSLYVYDKFVKSCYLSTEKITSSYVFNKIFLKDKTKFLNHFWKLENYEKYSQNKIIISAGSVEGIDICTLLNFKKDYVFLYLDNFNFYIGLGDFNTHELFSNLKEYLVKKDISKMIELVDKHCKDKFSLKDILVNTRRNILKKLIHSNVKDIDSKIDEIFSEQKNIIRELIDYEYFPIPLEMRLIIQLIVDNRIEQSIENFEVNNNYEDIFYFLSLGDTLGIVLDQEKFKLKFFTKLKEELQKLEKLIFVQEIDLQSTLSYIDKIEKFVNFSSKLGINHNLWESQNILFSIYNRFKKEKEDLDRIYNQELNFIHQKINLLADRLKIRIIF
ncbi:MAG: DUF3536 domain-containing protein, partial [bacterium]